MRKLKVFAISRPCVFDMFWEPGSTPHFLRWMQCGLCHRFSPILCCADCIRKGFTRQISDSFFPAGSDINERNSRIGRRNAAYENLQVALARWRQLDEERHSLIQLRESIAEAQERLRQEQAALAKRRCHLRARTLLGTEVQAVPWHQLLSKSAEGASIHLTDWYRCSPAPALEGRLFVDRVVCRFHCVVGCSNGLLVQHRAVISHRLLVTILSVFDVVSDAQPPVIAGVSFVPPTAPVHGCLYWLSLPCGLHLSLDSSYPARPTARGCRGGRGPHGPSRHHRRSDGGCTSPLCLAAAGPHNDGPRYRRSHLIGIRVGHRLTMPPACPRGSLGRTLEPRRRQQLRYGPRRGGNEL